MRRHLVIGAFAILALGSTWLVVSGYVDRSRPQPVLSPAPKTPTPTSDITREPVANAVTPAPVSTRATAPVSSDATATPSMPSRQLTKAQHWERSRARALQDTRDVPTLRTKVPADAHRQDLKQAPHEEEDVRSMLWSVDREGIKAAVEHAIPAIKTCYEGWLQDRPDLQGELLLAFTIDADPERSGEAKVTHAALEHDTLDQPFLSGCVIHAVSDLRFERPEEPTQVRYPLILAPASQAGDATP